MSRFSSATSEKARAITDDNLNAQALGISYGKYKAGILPDEEDGPYKRNSQSYITRREEPAEQDKKVAFIRIK